MSLSVKNCVKRVCPGFFLKAARKIKRKKGEAIYKIDMIMSPGEMKVFCPCCGLKFRSFTAGHFLEHSQRYNPSRYININQNVLCEYCGALPRHRILASWCEEHKELLRAAEILYFAPEYSMTLWMERNGVTCTTADLFHGADLKLDIQATGLPDESYDVIICNHVLEHVDDFRAALREIFRILRTGGCFICSFPMDPNVEVLDEDSAVQTNEERYKRYGQVDHQRVFGMKVDWFLTEAGFTVEKIDGEEYPKEILPVVGPADYDLNCLFCCVKG